MEQTPVAEAPPPAAEAYPPPVADFVDETVPMATPDPQVGDAGFGDEDIPMAAPIEEAAPMAEVAPEPETANFGGVPPAEVAPVAEPIMPEDSGTVPEAAFAEVAEPPLSAPEAPIAEAIPDGNEPAEISPPEAMQPVEEAAPEPEAPVAEPAQPVSNDAPPAEAGAVIGADAQPKLVVIRGQKINMEFSIYPDMNFIGRADEKPVDIDLDDQEPPDRIFCSRQHAVINFENGKITIEDLNSANGTYVNRERVYPGSKVDLKPNDVVQIGNVQLKLKV